MNCQHVTSLHKISSEYPVIIDDYQTGSIQKICHKVKPKFRRWVWNSERLEDFVKGECSAWRKKFKVLTWRLEACQPDRLVVSWRLKLSENWNCNVNLNICQVLCFQLVYEQSKHLHIMCRRMQLIILLIWSTLFLFVRTKDFKFSMSSLSKTWDSFFIYISLQIYLDGGWLVADLQSRSRYMNNSKSMISDIILT